jgi:hypothetical protein
LIACAASVDNSGAVENRADPPEIINRHGAGIFFLFPAVGLLSPDSPPLQQQQDFLF